MAWTRKCKAVVAFIILELLEDPNDRVKRGKTRELLKERAEKEMFHTVIQLSLQGTPAFKETMRISPDQAKKFWTQLNRTYANRAPKWTENHFSRWIATHTRSWLPIENEKLPCEIYSNCWEWKIVVWQKKITIREYRLFFFWAAKSKQSAESILSLVSSHCRRVKMAQQSEHEPRYLPEEVRVLTEQMSQPYQSIVSLFLDARKVEEVIQARASIKM